MRYYDEIYADKDKKYYKRFKAIKKGKRKPSSKDLIYVANLLNITEAEAKKEQIHIYYAYDIDTLLENKSNWLYIFKMII